VPAAVVLYTFNHRRLLWTFNSIRPYVAVQPRVPPKNTWT
jgi:hypothetical protein